MLTILHHELKYYFNNSKEVIYLYSFFISVLLLVPFSLEVEDAKIQSLGVMSLWVSLACATSMGAQGLYARDHAQGRLAYYQLLPIALEGIVFAKWLAFYLLLLLPLLAALPVAAILYDWPAGAVIHNLIGLTAGAAGLSMIASLASALVTGMEKAGAVLSLITLPLAIPALIFGAAYGHDISVLWQPNLIFLLGFATFMLPVMCFVAAHSIRYSH